MPLGDELPAAFGPLGFVVAEGDAVEAVEPTPPAAVSVDELDRPLGEEPPPAAFPGGVGPPDPVAVDMPPTVEGDAPPPPGTVEPPGTLLSEGDDVSLPPLLAGADCAVFV